MKRFNGTTLDMSSDGRFIEPPKPTLKTIFARVAVFGVLLLIAAVAFWLALFIIPLLLILGIAGYAVARAQMRRY